MSGTSCPNSDELTAYAVGDLPEDSVQALANHIDTCASCQAALTTLDDLQDPWTRRVRQAAGDLSASEPECEEAIVRTWDAVGKLVSSDGSSASMTMTTVPEQLGEYRLMEKLGEGGMGAVYKAFHVKLQRAVALKVLPSRHTENAQTVARFEREMATVGQLDDPNIVGAYDARELDGQRFLVMELVDGVNLAELVKRCGPLPVSDACELTRQIALGLDHAHRRGLVHRDIKPSNVMLASDGRAKILDFGLALLKVEQPTEGDMTVVGLAMGTPDYMAPEQASDSHQVDIRADLYSLGCTLYHLLAGRPPYAGSKYKSRFDKMMAHVHDPVPPIQQSRPEIPEAGIEMLERLLAKDPKARFSEPSEVAEAAGKLAGNGDLASLLTRAGQVPQARRSAGDPSVPPEGTRASRPEDTRSDRSAKTRGHEISARLNVGNFGCGIVVAVACLLIAAIPMVWYGAKRFVAGRLETPLADARVDSPSTDPSSPTGTQAAMGTNALVGGNTPEPASPDSLGVDAEASPSINQTAETPARPRQPGRDDVPYGGYPQTPGGSMSGTAGPAGPGGNSPSRPTTTGTPPSYGPAGPGFGGHAPSGPSPRPPMYTPDPFRPGFGMQPGFNDSNDLDTAAAGVPQYGIQLPSGSTITAAQLDLIALVRRQTDVMYPMHHPFDLRRALPLLHRNDSLKGIFQVQSQEINGTLVAFHPSDVTFNLNAPRRDSSFWQYTVPSFCGAYKQGERSGKMAIWDEEGRIEFRGEYEDRRRNGQFCYFEEGLPRMIMQWNNLSLVGQIHLISDGKVVDSFDSETAARDHEEAGPVLALYGRSEARMRKRENELRDDVKKLTGDFQAHMAALRNMSARVKALQRAADQAAGAQGAIDGGKRMLLKNK